MASLFDVGVVYHSLMFLPMVGGIVLIQTILIAGIVGLFIAEAQTLAEQRLQKPLKSGWFVLLYLPFLLPPVVMHDMQLFRMVYSNWVELLVLFLLVRWYLRNTAIKRWELVLLRFWARWLRHGAARLFTMRRHCRYCC